MKTKLLLFVCFLLAVSVNAQTVKTDDAKRLAATVEAIELIEKSVTDAEKELAEIRVRFTDENIAVKNIQARINKLKEQLVGLRTQKEILQRQKLIYKK